MSIKLSPMTNIDFDNYLEKSIQSFSKQKVNSHGGDEFETLEETKKLYLRLLPDGINTKNNFFYNILNEASQIKQGVLWIELDQIKKNIFIYDIEVYKEFQRTGIGSQVIHEIELIAKLNEINCIELHVFHENTSAVLLYKKLGFRTTSMYMKKEINAGLVATPED